MKVPAIIHEAEEGGYWAEVPSLPGCFTEGETLEEVKANLAEAIRGWLKAETRKVKAMIDKAAGAKRSRLVVKNIVVNRPAGAKRSFGARLIRAAGSSRRRSPIKFQAIDL
jgi:predicted RNase H-like HicB family nuclease